MKIHHIRNATCVIESASHAILVDPMLSQKGALPPFTFFRRKPLRNPLVQLPEGTEAVLETVTHAMVTHCQKNNVEALTHTDHLDRPGRQFLKGRQIPVVCRREDASYLEKHRIHVSHRLTPWVPESFLNGRVTAVPARHGDSWVRHLMANGVGFFLELPDEPSLYISGDTVFTRDVEKALQELKPDIAVVAAGSAAMDIGGPILMPLEQVLRFIPMAPGTVIANHMDALNHCSTTRDILRKALAERGLEGRVLIPEDGETSTF